MPEPSAGVALLVLLAQSVAVFAHGGEPFAVRRHLHKPPILEIVYGLAQVCDIYTHLQSRDHIFFAAEGHQGLIAAVYRRGGAALSIRETIRHFIYSYHITYTKSMIRKEVKKVYF